MDHAGHTVALMSAYRRMIGDATIKVENDDCFSIHFKENRPDRSLIFYAKKFVGSVAVEEEWDFEAGPDQLEVSVYRKKP